MVDRVRRACSYLLCDRSFGRRIRSPSFVLLGGAEHRSKLGMFGEQAAPELLEGRPKELLLRLLFFEDHREPNDPPCVEGHPYPKELQLRLGRPVATRHEHVLSTVYVVQGTGHRGKLATGVGRG